jgi:hypothetical protein
VDPPLCTLLQILSVTFFEEMLIHQAVTGAEYKLDNYGQCNQLNLFMFLVIGHKSDPGHLSRA